MAPPLRLLITGLPGVGKTTLVDNVAKGCKDNMKVLGFLSREVRDAQNNRIGFEMETLDGSKKAPLASKDEGPPGDKRRKMGPWYVDINSFETLVLPILDEALKGDDAGDAVGGGPRAFIFDEIGKMELFSEQFVDRVRKLLTSKDENLHVLGTVAQKGDGLIEQSKALAEVMEISKESRDAVTLKVKDLFLKAAAAAATTTGSEAPADAASSSAAASSSSAAAAAPTTTTPMPNGVCSPKEKAKAKAKTSRWKKDPSTAATKKKNEEDDEDDEEEKAEGEAAAAEEEQQEEKKEKEKEHEEAASAAAPAAASESGEATDLPSVRFDRPPKGQFSAVYLKDPPANFASLNAGDYALYVGGGAINLGFAQIMEAAGQTPDKRYPELHKALLEAGFANPGKLAWIHPGMVDHWYMGDSLAMLGIVPPYEEFVELSPVGLISIAVFPERLRPHGNKRNIAMVYAVGPNAGNVRKKGRREVDNMSKDKFLDVVAKLGENAASAVQQYNAVVQEAEDGKHMETPEARVRKLDPDCKKLFTFEELAEKYKGKYSDKEIKEYWARHCKLKVPKGDASYLLPPSGVAASLPKIEVLRICLLSGGVYMHPKANKVEVAAAIVKGLVAKGGGPNVPVLDFAFDEDSFAKAWVSLGHRMPTGA